MLRQASSEATACRLEAKALTRSLPRAASTVAPEASANAPTLTATATKATEGVEHSEEGLAMSGLSA